MPITINPLIDHIRGVKREAPIPKDSMIIPRAITQSDKDALEAVELLNEPTLAKTGNIWQMDAKTNRFSSRGSLYALVVGKYPKPMTPFEYELVKRGAIAPMRIDLATDYTRCPRYPLHRLNQEGGFDHENIAQVRAQVLENCADPEHVRPLDELIDSGRDTRKVAVLCMTGPSLKLVAEQVNNLDRSKYAVIAMNSAALAVKHDYYFALDRRIKPEWATASQAQGATAVLHPMVPPQTIKTFTSNGSPCYIFGHPGRHHLNETVRACYGDNYYGMVELEMGANVGCSALHFAYLMGYKKIIIVGMDVVWDTQNQLHWKAGVNGLTYDDPDDVKTLRVDMTNGDVLTAKCRTEYLRAYTIVVGSSFWLLQAGVEVLNCTGQGLLWEHPDTMAIWGMTIREDIHGNERWLSPLPSYTFEEVTTALNAR